MTNEQFDRAMYDIWENISKPQKYPKKSQERVEEIRQILKPLFDYEKKYRFLCECLVSKICTVDGGIKLACKILEESNPEEAISNLEKEFY